MLKQIIFFCFLCTLSVYSSSFFVVWLDRVARILITTFWFSIWRIKLRLFRMSDYWLLWFLFFFVNVIKGLASSFRYIRDVFILSRMPKFNALLTALIYCLFYSCICNLLQFLRFLSFYELIFHVIIFNLLKIILSLGFFSLIVYILYYSRLCMFEL